MIIVNDKMEEKVTAEDLAVLTEIIRLPKNSDVDIVEATLDNALAKVKLADLNIFSLNRQNRLADLSEISRRTRISALFCSDSGYENAFV